MTLGVLRFITHTLIPISPTSPVPAEPLLCKFADGGQKKRLSQGKYLQNGRPWGRDGDTVRTSRSGAVGGSADVTLGLPWGFGTVVEAGSLLLCARGVGRLACDRVERQHTHRVYLQRRTHWVWQTGGEPFLDV